MSVSGKSYVWIGHEQDQWEAYSKLNVAVPQIAALTPLKPPCRHSAFLTYLHLPGGVAAILQLVLQGGF